jgi:hypothetical protein
MNFEIDPQPRDESEKEQMYDLFFNKERILSRSDIETVMEKIRAVVEAIHAEPKEVKEVKEEKKNESKKSN